MYSSNSQSSKPLFDFGSKGSIILLPTSFPLSETEFFREGDDLIIKFHDQTMVIDNYFVSPQPLVTAEGTSLMVGEILALIYQSDQRFMVAENGMADVPTSSAQAKIGIVEMVVEGPITAQDHAGVSRTLQQGDAVYLQDTLITSNRSYVKITLNDGSVFQLGPLSRATLDKYSYHADKPEEGGKFETSVSAGIFRFISGKISGDQQGEHTTIKTPAANIGIRGSEIDGIIDADGSTTILHMQGYIEVNPIYRAETIDVFESGTTIHIPAITEAAVSVYRATDAQTTQIRDLLAPLNDDKQGLSILSEKEILFTDRPEAKVGDIHQPEQASIPTTEPETPFSNPTHGRPLPSPHLEFEEPNFRSHMKPPRFSEGFDGNFPGKPFLGKPFDERLPLESDEWPGQKPFQGKEPPPPEELPPPEEEELPLPIDSSGPDGVLPEPTIYYSFNEDNSIIINEVLPPQYAKEEVEILSPRHGSIINNRDGSFTYTPFPGFSGDDSFGYRFVNENITLRNHHPFTIVDVRVEPSAIELPANARYNQPQYGHLVVDDQGHLSYIPRENYYGNDYFTYSTNGETFAVEIQLISVNDAPIAQSDIDPLLTTDEDRSLTINAELLLNNDYEPDGDPVTIHIQSSSNSIVTVNSDGNLSYLPHPDFYGQDTFSYFLEDSLGVRSNTATVAVTVNPVNDAPIVGHETFFLESSDTTLSITVAQLLANDHDVENDALTITEVLNAVNGGVTLDSANGLIMFTPTTFGDGYFEYRVSDGQDSSIGQVNILFTPIPSATGGPVTGKNQLPVAVEDTITLARDEQTLNISVQQLLNNDTDPDGDTLSIISVNSIEGTVVLDKVTNEITFTPTVDFATTQIGLFTYTVIDQQGGSAMTTVTIIPANEPPTAVEDTLRVTVDQPTVIASATLLDNDTDTDGDTLTITAVTQGSHGEVVLDPESGEITFVPTAEFYQTGQATFSYTVSDGYGGTSDAQVALTANYPPVAIDDNRIVTATTTQITISVSELLSNDGDVNQEDILTITAVDDAINGNVSFNTSTEEITFIPHAEFALAGGGQFTYTLDDGHGGTDTAVVTFYANSSPQPGEDKFVVATDEVHTFTREELLQNDVDDDVLTIIAVDTAVHGQVALDPNSQQVTFIPTADFKTHGGGNFTYTVTDSHGATATTMVTLIINDELHATDDEIVITTSGTEEIVIPHSDLLANDSSANDYPFTITEVGNAVRGEVNLETATVTFIPSTDFINQGQGQFTYTVTNDHGDTATATVTLKANRPPLAQPDNFVVTKETPLLIQASELTANDRDPEGDDLVITSVSTPQQGTATIREDGNIEYTPRQGFTGTDQFEYTIEDSQGGQSSATVTLKINTPPSAQLDEFSTLVNQPLTLATAELLANDSDEDDDLLTVTEISQPDHGTVTLLGDQIEYSPNSDFIGEDQFTYTVSDGQGGSDTAPVVIKVEKVSLEAVDDTLEHPFNVPVVIPATTLLNNDKSSDPELTVVAVQADPNSGVDVNLIGDEILVFVNALVNNSLDTVDFEYTVTNTDRESDTATVTLKSSNVIQGTSADDVLVGSDGVDLIFGHAGNDTFMPISGADKVFGNQGDDTFLLDQNIIPGTLIDGGEGNDTLQLVASGQYLYLNDSLINEQRVNLQGIDRINLGSGNQLRLSIDDVLEISDSGRLVIDGNGSLVNSVGWTVQDSVQMNGASYTRYTASGAELLVNQEVFALIN